MKQERILRVLKGLNLDENAIGLYQKLLYQGPKTVSEISMITNMNYDEIIYALEQLENVNLVDKIPGVPERYEILPPYYIFIKIFTDLSDEILNFSSLISKNIEENINQVTGNINAVRSRIMGFLEDIKGRISGEVNRVVEKVLSEVEGEFEGIIGIIEESVEESMSMLDMEMNRVYGLLMTSTERTISGILQDANEMNKTIENIQNEVKITIRSTLREKLNSLTETSKKLLDERVANIEKIIESTTTLFNNLEDVLEKSVKSLYELLKESVEQNLNDAKEKLLDKLTNSSEKVSLLVNKVNSLISEKKEENKDLFGLQADLKQIELTVRECKTITSLEFEDIYNEIIKSLERDRESLIKYLKENLEKEKTSFLEGIRESILDLRNNLREIIIKELPVISEETETVINTINEKISEVIQNSREIASRLQKIYEEAGNSTLKVYKELRDKIKENYKIMIENVKQNLRNKVNELTKSVETSLLKISTELNRILMEPFEEVNRIVEEGHKNLKKTLDDMLEMGIKERVEALKRELSETLINLDEFYKEIETRRIEIRSKVWPVRGITAIKAYMKDALKRAKHIVLIISPKLEWLPIKELSELGENTRVQIAVNFNRESAEELEKIDKLKTTLKKVMIRYYPRKIVLGFIVDDREGLFAPIPDEITDEETVEAIASASREYIMAFRDYLAQAWTSAENV